MPHFYRSPLRDRIRVELVEADVEIIFSLVDSAEAASLRGNAAFASRAIQDAEDVFRDIEQRLHALGRLQREPFRQLMDELRKEIDVAKSRV